MIHTERPLTLSSSVVFEVVLYLMVLSLTSSLYQDLLFEADASIYGNLAALTALSYDIIICVDLEVEVIWKKKWALPKLFYLLSRYLGLMGTITTVLDIASRSSSNEVCHIMTFLRYILLVSSAVAVEFVLLIRVYALYRESKIVLAITAALTLVLGGISCALLGLFLAGQRGKDFVNQAPTANLPFPGCYSLNRTSNSFSNYFWIPLLVFESGILKKSCYNGKLTRFMSSSSVSFNIDQIYQKCIKGPECGLVCAGGEKFLVCDIL
ncbi:hypothetical protein K439DRAFT_1412348, partial [Ramaria rubella]